jgi:hypothetical protein
MFQGLILPNGESACPQGMDWELHGIPYINLFASLASYQHDPLAAHMENTYLQYIRAWQQMCNGDLAVPGSTLGFTRHAICAEQTSYAFLAHKIFGPPVKELSISKAARLVEGVRTDDWVQVISDRTEDKFVSFSWTNRIMGMLVPIGPGHLGNPDFTVPLINGFVGSFDLSPADNKKPIVLEHTWKKTANGFETSGTLLVNGGRLKQTLRMTSIGRQAVVYQDRVVAMADLSVKRERGVSLGIENDEITGGTRSVSSKDGTTLFDWQKPKPLAAVSGSWANVDSRLGIIMAAGSGISYQQATAYQQGMAVYPDILYASFSDHPRHFKAGEEVAHRVAILYVEVTPSETSNLAQSWKIENAPSGPTLRFKLPESGESKIPLL